MFPVTKCAIILFLVCRFVATCVSMTLSTIKIRAGDQIQYLPVSFMKSWGIHTVSSRDYGLYTVENGHDEEAGWVHPTSFEQLFLPVDLPFPLARPALGIVIANGMLRYLMPSVVLSLTTPDRVWRNRGLNSLPRARCWIDLLRQFTPSLHNMQIAAFGKVTDDVRFLEDQDGAAAWETLSLSEDDEVRQTFENFRKHFNSGMYEELKDGYHFVDIPLLSCKAFRIPKYQLKMYLSDFEDPKRLLEIEGEDEAMLDSEPCGELDIMCRRVSAGGKSSFLTEVYRDLYEEGNIIQ